MSTAKAYSYPAPNVSCGYCCQLGFNYRVILFANRLTLLFDGVPFQYSRYDAKVALEMHEDKIQPKDVPSILKFVEEYSFLGVIEDKKIDDRDNEQMSLF